VLFTHIANNTLPKRDEIKVRKADNLLKTSSILNRVNESYEEKENRLLKKGSIESYEPSKKTTKHYESFEYRPLNNNVKKCRSERKQADYEITKLLFTPSKIASRKRNSNSNHSFKEIPRVNVECTFKPNMSLTKNYKHIIPLKKNIVRDKKSYSMNVETMLKHSRTQRQLQISKSLAQLNIPVKQHKNECVEKREYRKVVEKMRENAYRKMFNLLDANKDGLIAAKDIDISCNFHINCSNTITHISINSSFVM